MKFGKRREKSGIQVKKFPSLQEPTGAIVKKEKRTPESYRRQEPSPEQITNHLRMEIENCSECGELLIDKKEHVHYREDLQEVENLIKTAQKIVRVIVESGRCQTCNKRQFALDIPKQKVIIGENIRMMVVYLVIVQGQSYSEIQRDMKHQYGMNLSNGEVANILEGESILLTPSYNHIAEELEEESKEIGAHYDETSWKTRSRGEEISEGNYCWIKVGMQTENRLIWFGRSRGKRVAEELRGRKKGSKGVSDDYRDYMNLFDHHGLCWAHPHRKFRDLAGSGKLKGKIKKTCEKMYKDFAKVYQKARRAREKLQSGVWTDEEKRKQKGKLIKLFEKLCEVTPHDPEKLKTLRETLQKRKDRYFTFFDFPQFPLDNNKAERGIRKVVLKRKKSLGCQSQKGANVLSILYSVVFSLMESHPDRNFFNLYQEAAEFGGQ